MKPIRIAGIAATAFATLSLTGCWDSYDLEKNRYVTGTGFDYADGQFIIYAQMLDFSYIAKQEKGKSESPAVIYIGKGQGTTTNMAANDLYLTAQQKVLWSHITSVVVTEAALKEGIEGFEDTYDRYRETRYTQWIYGTRGSIETLFKTSDFFNMSALTSILHEPTSNYRQESWIPPIRWVHFFADILEPGKTVILPTLSVNRNQWKQNEEGSPKLLVDGAFILSGKKFKGWLSKDQLIGLRWLNPETRRTPLPIKAGNRLLGVLSLEKPKLKITETFAEGAPHYRIKLSVKGSIIEMKNGATEQEMRTIGESLIREEVQQTFRHGVAINADVYQLSYHTYLHHYGIWKQMGRQGPDLVNKDSLESIEVDLKLMHSGSLRTYVQN